MDGRMDGWINKLMNEWMCQSINKRLSIIYSIAQWKISTREKKRERFAKSMSST